MSDGVAIALIGLIGTIITTVGVMWVKHKFDLQNRRITERESEEKRYERLDDTFREMIYSARHKEMQIKALGALCDSRPDYVLARIREIANEPSDVERWEKYVNP